MPTLLQFLEIPLVQPIQAVSFLPLITATGHYTPLTASYRPEQFAGPFENYSVRIYGNDYTFTECPWDNKQLLFDISKDPQEQTDLSEQKPEITKKLKSTVRELKKGNREFLASLKVNKESVTKADRKVLDQLKSLGYVD